MQILYWLKSSTPLQGKLKSSLVWDLISASLRVTEKWANELTWTRCCFSQILWSSYSFLSLYIGSFSDPPQDQNCIWSINIQRGIKSRTCMWEKGESKAVFKHELWKTSGESNQIKWFTTSAALHVSHVFSTLEINWFMQAAWVKHAGGRAQDHCCLLWIHSKHSITYSFPHMGEIMHFMDSDRAGWDIKWPFSCQLFSTESIYVR